METVVLLRNAEKPAEGRPLDCKGLNRALALPGVLQDQFGKPDALFAPQSDTSSLRPFATLEPTSNIFGLRVDESIGRENVELLVKTLTRSLYRSALVVVAWPHHNIPDIARRLLSHNGIADAGIVEYWPADDYDSMYVLKINWTEQKGSFEKKSQGLDTLPETCPRSIKPDG